MAVVFPYPRELKCFRNLQFGPIGRIRNPQLYFSLLPRDILEYYLRPLLEVEGEFFLCDEHFIPPVLVKSVTIPLMGQLTAHQILKNGNLLIIGQRNGLHCINFRTGRMIWSHPQIAPAEIQYYF